jgi:hypothetical protein
LFANALFFLVFAALLPFQVALFWLLLSCHAGEQNLGKQGRGFAGTELMVSTLDRIFFKKIMA